MATQSAGKPVPNPRLVMPPGADRIFVSIGVSKPGGGLEPLPGAITASVRMAQWAKGQGYATLLLNDDDLPEITTDILRIEITKAINLVTDNTELLRLVVFFAGHGAAQAIGDQYWILSNWAMDSSQAIKITSLQRMLEYYGPRQVSLIGDACQEFSARFIDIVGSAVLYRTGEKQRFFELDQFFAVDVGKQAFMIKAKGDQEDFCLFTEVLLDALEGDAQGDYFDTVGADKVVTSHSLARYLQATVAKEAGKYGVQMNPCPRPGFFTDTTYLRIPEPPRADLSVWISNVAVGGGGGLANSGSPDVLEIIKKMVLSGLWLLIKLVTPKPPRRSVKRTKLIKPKSIGTSFEDQSKALKSAREANLDAFKTQVRNASNTFSPHINLGIAISGAEVSNIQASLRLVSNVGEQRNSFQVIWDKIVYNNFAWCDTLVTLTDGRIVPVCVVHDSVAVLHIIDAASLVLFHRENALSKPLDTSTVDVLAMVHAGSASPADALVWWTKVRRRNEPSNLMLNCIIAQFFDLIRNVVSLRSMVEDLLRMAQPIPLDIALYGGGAICDHEGRLFADISQFLVPEGKQNETLEFRAYPIAGRVPWMRQAWGAVATARCDASAETWREQALAAMEHLAPGLFTVAKPSGHAAFVKLAGIKDIQN